MYLPFGFRASPALSEARLAARIAEWPPCFTRVSFGAGSSLACGKLSAVLFLLTPGTSDCLRSLERPPLRTLLFTEATLLATVEDTDVLRFFFWAASPASDAGEFTDDCFSCSVSGTEPA